MIHVLDFYKDFRKKASDMTSPTVVKPVMVDLTPARHPTKRFPEGKEGKYILVTINANLSSNPTESTLPADIDTLSWGKKINLEDFEERINEIDQEIRKFDISSKTISVTQDSTTSTATGDVNPCKSTASNPRPSKTGSLQDVIYVRPGQQGEKPAKWLRIDCPLALGAKTQLVLP